MMAKTMRAAGFNAIGPNAKAEVVEGPMPEPGANEVRIAVKFATINPADLLVKTGAAKPMFPDAPPPHWGGLEFAGIVESAGTGAKLAAGTRVAGVSHFAGTGRGAHAEYVVAPVSAIAEVPDGMPLDIACCVPMSGLTALLAVDHMSLNSGDAVAIVGAAGSVGAFAVEIAAKRGVRVIAVAGESDAGFIRSLGASDIVARGPDWIDHLKKRAPNGVTALLDTALVGDGCLPAIADNGTMIALRASHLPADPPRGIKAELISVREYYDRSDKLAGLLEMVAAGPRPRIARTFGIEDAGKAFDAAEDSSVKGRVLLAF